MILYQDPETGFWDRIVHGGRDIGRLRTHPPEECASEKCDIHRRPEKFWGLTLLWRYDRGIVEQVCEHGIGHPSPSEHVFQTKRGTLAELVHGCCGECCEEWYE